MDSSASSHGYPMTLGRVAAILGLVASTALIGGAIGVPIGVAIAPKPADCAPAAVADRVRAPSAINDSEVWALDAKPLPRARK